MAPLGNCNLGENINFRAILKIFTFTVLTWICLTYYDDAFPKSLENKIKSEKSLNIDYNRLLARHELQRESEYRNMREKLSDGRTYRKEINFPGNKSTYAHVKKKGSNNIDIYMKNYKKRYAKKKGLLKLDCYWEKKLFDQICYMDNLAEKMKNNKKSLKKKIIKKYGYALIIISFIPVILGIWPMIHNRYFSLLPKICFKNCNIGHKDIKGTTRKHDEYNYIELPITRTTWDILTYLNSVIVWLSIIFVLSLVIYIFLKVIKYERLMRGKSKMSVKDYCRFCKDVF
ncbi:Plasmodium exported protein, unknown function [Plasmodium vivax]|uniref:Fam-l protein n=1 Tax=Plasmodium vivax TaxID=5855 RepID=A0A565A6B4_PLAVI|nr:Plasmodium exported protein, unknown function [Plasmodium vivax]VVA00059.1 Plasmodium exported protein, unknown function [Plasmodium vivax]